MRRERGGGEISGTAELKSSAGLNLAIGTASCSVLAVFAGKCVRRFAKPKAKIRRSAIKAMVDSVSYPVSKIVWFHPMATSANGQSTQTIRIKANSI